MCSGGRGTTTTTATTTTTTATTNGLPIPVALLAVVAGVRRGLAVGVAVAVDVAVAGLDVQRHRGAAPWQSKDNVLGEGHRRARETYEEGSRITVGRRTVAPGYVPLLVAHSPWGDEPAWYTKHTLGTYGLLGVGCYCLSRRPRCTRRGTRASRWWT